MGNIPDLIGTQWRKSSHSAQGECIEVAALGAAQWRKSSHSAQGDCIEVAAAEGLVAVRDSKNPEGPALAFSPAAFTAFVTAAAKGEFEQH